MNSGVALALGALLAFGIAVAGALWLAGEDPGPAPTATLPEAARPAEAAEDSESRELLVPPPAWVEPPAQPEEAPPAPAAEPAGAQPQSIIEETEGYWQEHYDSADAVQLRRDLALLEQQFRKQSSAEYERRFDDGRYELVEGASEPRNDPWRPGAFLQMERPGGEAADQVHRVVLYQYEVPELYALQAKLYWLQRRLDALAPPSGG